MHHTGPWTFVTCRRARLRRLGMRHAPPIQRHRRKYHRRHHPFIPATPRHDDQRRTKTLCVEFQYGDEEKAKKVKTSSYRIDIPYDKETGLSLQFRPFVNTGNGKRFYLLDTGTPQGTKLIAYAKGEYHTAFDAATLAGDYKKSEIEITKKEIKITLEDAEGNTASYPLTYDNKTKMFTAEGAEIKADTEAEGNTEVEVNIESKGNTETTESTETAKSEA